MTTDAIITHVFGIWEQHGQDDLHHYRALTRRVLEAART